MAPESAAPSAMAYRGALFALAVGTLVAVFLAISPPTSKSEADQARRLATPTPSFAATATPTRAGGATPRATATPPPPAATQAPATPAATTSTYTVAPGDTLSGIAEQFNTSIDAIVALNPGLTENLRAGQAIQVPAAP
jgi:LysM repeat protein